jgi:isoquinoline 1-oxidoreductase alpha subunit
MIQLTVNRVSRSFDGDPEMPLLWFLRDELRLTGTKYGCGLGLCGACTVHLDGQAVRSCQTPMKAAAGKRVTTIEGLAPNGEHSLQVAWKQHNVPQCGYCQSGQIMQAAALLREKPHPADADIDAAMEGNICRCGTYQRILAAIKTAAAGPARPVHEGQKPTSAEDPRNRPALTPALTAEEQGR